MSFNQPHITITRSNYEEYFLLYVDGELTEQECDAVEAFAAAHPDLQEELDILLTTRLDAEPVVLGDKSALMADSMKTAAIDESLLLYIDNELTGEEKAGLEWELSKNKDLKLQHQLLQKAKLDPAETIVYPYKEELYRRTEKPVRPLYWWRAAAAAVVLLGWGGFWYWDNYGTPESADTIALGSTPATTAPTTTPGTDNPAPQVRVPVTEATTTTAETTTRQHTTAEAQELLAATPARRSNDRADAREPVAMPTEQPTDAAQVTTPARVEAISSTPQQDFNNQPVTVQSSGTYNTIDVPTGEDARGSVAKEDNDKKGSMRGFLRKTTRYIERRTGIDPTNNGDELVIGALTINLK
jgi:hypothetical protein